MSARQQKITFAEMSDMGVRGLLVYLRRLSLQPQHRDHRRRLA
jgi:hypothetical protein